MNLMGFPGTIIVIVWHISLSVFKKKYIYNYVSAPAVRNENRIITI